MLTDTSQYRTVIIDTENGLLTATCSDFIYQDRYTVTWYQFRMTHTNFKWLIFTSLVIINTISFTISSYLNFDSPRLTQADLFTPTVSPTSISVVGKEDGASVEVKAGTAITLECLVTDARPAASVMWYRDGLMLDQGWLEKCFSIYLMVFLVFSVFSFVVAYLYFILLSYLFVFSWCLFTVYAIRTRYR